MSTPARPPARPESAGRGCLHALAFMALLFSLPFLLTGAWWCVERVASLPACGYWYCAPTPPPGADAP